MEFLFENKTYPGPIDRVPATQEFIDKNNLSLDLTQSEILQLIKQIEDRGLMISFQNEVYFNYLSFESAKPRIKEENIPKYESGEKTWTYISDVREATQDMLDYLVFGLGKALDERGLSCSRTIQKLEAWLTLLGREDLAETVSDDSLYSPYGMPALLKVCANFEIDPGQDCKDFVWEV